MTRPLRSISIAPVRGVKAWRAVRRKRDRLRPRATRPVGGENGPSRYAPRGSRASEPTTGGDAMIDHVSLGVRDLARSTALYDALLAHLSYSRLMTRESTVGYGKRYPDFWLNARP